MSSRWSQKLGLSKSALESTWLYHEIGRCHLEIENFSEALLFGEKSVSAAQEAQDDMWLLNATVLIAQAQVKLKDFSSAHDMFIKALDMAKSQGKNVGTCFPLPDTWVDYTKLDMTPFSF